jgi:hypothetical protein
MFGLAVEIMNICGSAHADLRIFINSMHEKSERPCPMVLN